MNDIAARLESVLEKIEHAAARSGRNRSEIALVAVSKTHPAGDVAAAVQAGQLLFGENKVQEARLKIPESPGAATWHLIGHLQKNKIRQALPLFDLFHGIDSIELARQINRIAEEESLHARILLEVNVAGESTKFGFEPDAVLAAIEALLPLPRLTIDGLMAMAPFSAEPETARPYFAQLRDLHDKINQKLGIQLAHLSMGMSGDYEVAIEEGATLVRVGSAIFGERPKAIPVGS